MPSFEVDGEGYGNLYQIMKVLRVNHLSTSTLSDLIKQIGKFKMVERRVNLNAARKRNWFSELKEHNVRNFILWNKLKNLLDDQGDYFLRP